jgi:hypothetical protein
MLALLRYGQADHHLRRPPFGHKLLDRSKPGRRNCRQGMRRAQLGLADGDSNALETEIEGENRARAFGSS